MRKEKIMKKEEMKPKKKQPYVEPKVIATYEKDELEEAIKPAGVENNFSAGGGTQTRP